MASFVLRNFTVSLFKQISAVSFAQMSLNSVNCETSKYVLWKQSRRLREELSCF